MPKRMEERVLPNGMTQKVNLTISDFERWALKLSNEQVSAVISLWSQEKEEAALDLLLSYR